MVAIMLALPILAQQPMGTFDVGGAKVTVPSVEGYVDACSVDERIESLAKTLTPHSNELISCFFTSEDFDELRTTGGPKLSPYFLLQVMTASKGGGISQAHFDAFATQLETMFGAQFEKFWQENKKAIGEQIERAEVEGAAFIGADVELEVGQMAPIETTRVAENQVTSVWMTQGGGTAAGVTISIKQVQTSTALLIDGRVIVLFAYQRYEKPSDADALKTLTQQWVDGIVKLSGSDGE
ncbi:MAG: hypothetical protein GY716_17780 [bacterium]|nr:hypothetical protein [bacterium]